MPRTKQIEITATPTSEERNFLQIFRINLEYLAGFAANSDHSQCSNISGLPYFCNSVGYRCSIGYVFSRLTELCHERSLFDTRKQ